MGSIGVNEGTVNNKISPPFPGGDLFWLHWIDIRGVDPKGLLDQKARVQGALVYAHAPILQRSLGYAKADCQLPGGYTGSRSDVLYGSVDGVVDAAKLGKPILRDIILRPVSPHGG